jgi:hypothetical protein
MAVTIGLGDYVIEGLHDAFVESGEDFLKVAAGHDQFTERGIVRFPRRPGLEKGGGPRVGLIQKDVERLTPIRGHHASPALGLQCKQDFLPTFRSVKSSDGGNAH